MGKERTNNNRIKSEKRIISKKAIAIILSVLVTIFLAEVFVLSKLSTEEKRFRRTINVVKKEVWSDSFDESKFQISAKTKELSFIGKEYEYIKIYEDNEYENKNFNDLVHSYINSTKECKMVIEKYPPEKDYKNFWQYFSVPYGQRVKALYSLADEGYISTKVAEKASHFNSIIATGWALSKTETIEFTIDKDKSGFKQLIATIQNDSGYDIDYFNVEVELFDEKGKSLGDINAYADNIKKGTTFELRAYLEGENVVKQFLITAVTCAIKDEKTEINKSLLKKTE